MCFYSKPLFEGEYYDNHRLKGKEYYKNGKLKLDDEYLFDEKRKVKEYDYN